MIYDTEDPTLIAKMNDEMRAIESMVIVGVLKYTAAGTNPAGFAVTLRCRASRDEGSCGKKGEGPVRLNRTSVWIGELNLIRTFRSSSNPWKRVTLHCRMDMNAKSPKLEAIIKTTGRRGHRAPPG